MFNQQLRKPSAPIASQHDHGLKPEKQGKGKEKREKMENGFNQLAAHSTTNETLVKEKERVNGEPASAEAALDRAARSSKPRKQKNKAGTVPPIREETSSISATAKPQTAAVEAAAPSPSVPVSTVDNGERKETSRKRKGPGAGDDLVQPVSKQAELATAEKGEQAVNGKPRKERNQKKSKKT